MRHPLRRPAVSLLLSLVLLAAVARRPAGAQEAADGTLDFSELVTPTCELIGLVARPPAGWFSVPIQEMPAGMAGCQMMRTDEREALVGIVRLRSAAAGDSAPGEESGNRLVASELAVLEAMGYQVGDPIWARENVPIRGEGFSAAKAVGLSAVVADSGLPQEVHFLLFQGRGVQYLLALLTPSRQAEPEIYQRNTDDFGVILRTLDVPSPGDG